MSRRNPFPLLDNPVPRFNINTNNTTLIILDFQYFITDKSGQIGKIAQDKGISAEFKEYFEIIEDIIPNIKKLIDYCRNLGIQIIFIRTASKTKDGRDMSLQNKAQGRIYNYDFDFSFNKSLQPDREDIIIDKTCDNPFNCTELEKILRNLSIEHIILCGVLSPGYLDTTALDAADRGFGVIVVFDAVAGGVRERKEYLTGGLLRIRDTNSIIELLEPLGKRGLS
jgi:nicotinamidase-related amidase